MLDTTRERSVVFSDLSPDIRLDVIVDVTSLNTDVRFTDAVLSRNALALEMVFSHEGTSFNVRVLGGRPGRRGR